MRFKTFASWLENTELFTSLLLKNSRSEFASLSALFFIYFRLTRSVRLAFGESIREISSRTSCSETTIFEREQWLVAGSSKNEWLWSSSNRLWTKERVYHFIVFLLSLSLVPVIKTSKDIACILYRDYLVCKLKSFLCTCIFRV